MISLRKHIDGQRVPDPKAVPSPPSGPRLRAIGELIPAWEDQGWEEQSWEKHWTEADRAVFGIASRTARAIAEKDEKLGREITSLTEKMYAIVTMTNLAEIRRAVIQITTGLHACVEKMTDESGAMISELAAGMERCRRNAAGTQ